MRLMTVGYVGGIEMICLSVLDLIRIDLKRLYRRCSTAHMQEQSLVYLVNTKFGYI